LVDIAETFKSENSSIDTLSSFYAQVFNRTSLQQKSLSLNGHTSPVEKLRYMDRYAVSGGKDNVIKVWAL
jgi:WD40 repeat protein